MGEWVLLAYRVPREPSTPRIAIWRSLRRLGVAQLLDGLVALPLDNRNREQFEWLADEIVEAHGEATLWVAQPARATEERVLQEQMASAIADEYRSIISAAKETRGGSSSSRARTLDRLRRELRRIEQRDYFPPPERERAIRAVEQLAAMMEVAP